MAPSDFDPDVAPAEGRRFPPTRRSAIALVGSDDPVEVARAFELLVRAYWRPVYAHVRLRWRKSSEDARDLTQAFFARALEKRQLAGFDAERARFRTYLKGALDNFVLEADRSERREKRGGAATRLALDFDLLEAELARSGPRDASAIDQAFEAEWTRALFSAVVTALETRCAREDKAAHFTIFRRYVIDPELSPDPTQARPSYAQLASELGLSVTDVTNHLAWARRTFRELALTELANLTASDDEFRSEARAVFGITP